MGHAEVGRQGLPGAVLVTSMLVSSIVSLSLSTGIPGWDGAFCGYPRGGAGEAGTEASPLPRQLCHRASWQSPKGKAAPQRQHLPFGGDSNVHGQSTLTYYCFHINTITWGWGHARGLRYWEGCKPIVWICRQALAVRAPVCRPLSATLLCFSCKGYGLH